MTFRELVYSFIGLLGVAALVLALVVTSHATPALGAAVGPDDPNNYHSLGGVQEYKKIYACNVGNATSTIVSVQNPLHATSTVSISINGVNGATSTDILAGTSTTPAPAGAAVATSSVGANLLGMFNIAANAKFASASGITMGPGTGWKAPSAGTYPTSQLRIGVGPSEYINVFATSTNPSGNGGIATSSLSLPASCNVTLSFIKV